MSRRWLATGVVEAPVNAAFAALLAVGPAATAHRDDPADEAMAVTDADGLRRYEVPVGDTAHTVTIELDQNRHTLAVQGHWWYRGVYSVHDHPRGSLIEYRVHNVATRGRWAVPLMQHRLPHQMRRDLAALLQAISERLGCPAYPARSSPDPGSPL
jgi:hypothetical protein